MSILFVIYIKSKIRLTNTVRLLQSFKQFPLLVVLLAICLQGRSDCRLLGRMILVERFDERKANGVDLEVFGCLAHTGFDVLLQFAVSNGQNVLVQTLRLPCFQLVELLQNRFVERHVVQTILQTDQLDGIVHEVTFDNVDQQIVNDPVPSEKEAERTEVPGRAQ